MFPFPQMGLSSLVLLLHKTANAPHRAEVCTLLVHRNFQRRGIGAALMDRVEAEAGRRNRSFPILDTVQGGNAERLCRRRDWQEIGIVPNQLVDPVGNSRASVYFIKQLVPAARLTAGAVKLPMVRGSSCSRAGHRLWRGRSSWPWPARQASGRAACSSPPGETARHGSRRPGQAARMPCGAASQRCRR